MVQDSQKFMIKRIALVLFSLTLVANAFATDKEVEALLAAMRKTYKEVKTAAFTMEATILSSNGDITITMDGVFKNPNKMSVKVNVEDKSFRMICDGTNLFGVSEDSPTIHSEKYSLDKMGEMLMGSNLEVINFYDWKRQLSTAKGDNMHDSKLSIRQNEKWNGRKWTVLEESAPTVGVYVEYYIDPATNFVWRTVRMSLDKEFIQGDFVLKSLKTGVKVEDSRFKKPVIAVN